MRQWTRARLRTACGQCAALIGVGDPIQQITIDGVRFVRTRCAACASGPVPPDLPALVELKKTEPLQVMRRFGLLPLDERDWKVAQAGDNERQPGEDDQ